VRRRWTIAVAVIASVTVVSSSTPATGGPSQTFGTDFRVHVGPRNTGLFLQLTTDNYQGGSGWTAAYPCDAGYQGTSSLNNVNSPVASNLTVVKSDGNGDVCVKSQHPTDLIVDYEGALTPANTDLASPRRLVDTRALDSSGCPAAVHVFGPPDSGAALTPVSRCECSLVDTPAGTCGKWTKRPGAAATAMPYAQYFSIATGLEDSVALVQVTTDNYRGTGWTAAVNCESGFTGSSNVNNTGQPIASNLAVVHVSDRLCVVTQAPSDVIVDLVGTLPDAIASTPTRMYDSRLTPGLATDYQVHVSDRQSIVVMQLTTDNYSGGSGWTSVRRCDIPTIATSNLNNVNSPIASNLVVFTTDAHGDICVRSQNPTDIVLDFIGTLPNAQVMAPQRVLDTRQP